MRFIKTLFWNESQSRLRAGWRLALQLILNIGLALLALRVLEAGAGSLDSNSSWGTIVLALVMVGVTLFSVWFAGRFLDRRLFSDFGLHLNRGAWWADLAFGLALGIVLPLGLAGLGVVTDTVSLGPVFTAGFPGLSFGLAVLLSALVYLCVGTFEEVARAYHIRNLLEGTVRLGLGFAAAIAVIGASVISVLMHTGNLAFLAFVLLATAIKGLCYLLTGRVGVALGYHAAWDFTLATVLGVGTQSGAGATAAFYAVHSDDPTWASAAGGNELGPPVLVALLGLELAALLLILGWTRWRYGMVTLHEDLKVQRTVRLHGVEHES